MSVQLTDDQTKEFTKLFEQHQEDPHDEKKAQEFVDFKNKHSDRQWQVEVKKSVSITLKPKE